MRRRSVRSLVALWWAVAVTLVLPALAFAQEERLDKPEGPDHTLTSIFVVAASLPLLLAILTLIDVARGRHTRRHGDH